jgi:hypothetical protein
MKKRYALTIRFEFSATDDPLARKIARGVRSAINTAVTLVGEEVTTKLQEVFPDKPPRKVTL